jgi:glyoxalase family protein
MKLYGLHHITLVIGDAQRTIDFYTRVLGLRLIKKTVNFDAPGSYHLYFGDEVGSPGTAITFFEWPDAPKGHVGIGGTHHFALITEDYPSLLRWKRRLTDRQVTVHGPYDRGPFQSIYFRDPDGIRIEIATTGPGWSVGDRPGADQSGDDWDRPVDEISSDMALLRGMHHISALSSDLNRTDWFYRDLLGMELIRQTTNRDNAEQAHWFWGVEGGRLGSLISYFQEDPQRTHRAQIGRGQTHHFALGVKDEDEQLEWRERILKAGLRVSPVMDRVYFKSIYTSDPDGHIVELATLGPGFLVDETVEGLGQSLRLPPWLEEYRRPIEEQLRPVTSADWALVREGR